MKRAGHDRITAGAELTNTQSGTKVHWYSASDLPVNIPNKNVVEGFCEASLILATFYNFLSGCIRWCIFWHRERRFLFWKIDACKTFYENGLWINRNLCAHVY